MYRIWFIFLSVRCERTYMYFDFVDVKKKYALLFHFVIFATIVAVWYLQQNCEARSTLQFSYPIFFSYLFYLLRINYAQKSKIYASNFFSYHFNATMLWIMLNFVKYKWHAKVFCFRIWIQKKKYFLRFTNLWYKYLK